jgi:hypothetical protein
MEDNNNVCLNTDKIDSISTEKVESKKIEDKKCAPGLKYEAGSCITLPVLVEMVKAYNKANQDKQIRLSCKKEVLHPRRYKKYLLKKIGEVSKQCNSQVCWTQQDFIKHMNETMKLQLEKFTLRPEGPAGQFKWLNTFDINQVMEQYEPINKKFLFLGAVPMDFEEIKYKGVADLDLNDAVNNDKNTKFGIIYNLDDHDQSGSHWVAGFMDMEDGRIYYYDSYGTAPEKRVVALMDKFSKFYEKNTGKKSDVRYNSKRHQFGNSECGVFSINFILNMLQDKDFDEIIEKGPNDKEVNKLRREFFRNTNF